MSLKDYGGDAGEQEKNPANKVFDEFDCPLCSAYNPYGDGFRKGDEIRCCYCGTEFKAHVSDEGKLKMKET
jgi:hypothetical protein